MFVDTEEEFDWAEPRRRDSTATTAIDALPDAHRRLAGFGLTPTYLIDYPVADNQRSADILRGIADGGGAVIGAQLHPWVNPPLDESMSSSNSFVGNLPIDIERAKLKLLTERIGQSLGARPIVYRAGRYGIGPNTARLLIEEGYRLDLSTRPLFDYREEGGPDFSGFPVWPWWADSARQLVELPLGASFTGYWSGLGHTIYPVCRLLPPLNSFMARTGFLQRVPLTPEGTPLADAILAIDQMMEEGHNVFSLSFHSPSIAPGHTPYVRDDGELAAFWRWWDGIFDYFARCGIEAASAIEFIAAVDRSG